MKKRLLIIDNTYDLDVDFTLPTITGNVEFTATNTTTGEGEITYLWELLSGTTVVNSATTTNYTYTITEWSDAFSLKLTANNGQFSSSITKDITVVVDMSMDYWSYYEENWRDQSYVYSRPMFVRGKAFRFRMSNPLTGVDYTHTIEISQDTCPLSTPSVIKTYNGDWNGLTEKSFTFSTSTPGSTFNYFTENTISNNRDATQVDYFDGIEEFNQMVFDLTIPVSIAGINYGPNSLVNPTVSAGSVRFGSKNQTGSKCYETTGDINGSYKFVITGPTSATQDWSQSTSYTPTLTVGSYTYTAYIKSVGGSQQTNTMDFTVV